MCAIDGSGYLDYTDVTKDTVDFEEMKDYWLNADPLTVECDLTSKIKYKIRKKLDEICGAENFYKSFKFINNQNRQIEVIIYSDYLDNEALENFINKFYKTKTKI